MKRDNTMTQRYLVDAGISLGMRVLEIGCGNGEVTQLLADLVGPSGLVLALDKNEAALEMARERMAKLDIPNVQFEAADITGDLSTLDAIEGEPFDALAGRRVLMYLKNPADILRQLAGRLRPEGLVVFEEADATMIPARTEPRPGHDQMSDWLKRMLLAEGANLAMGFELPAILVKAGLKFERVRAEAIIEGQGTQFPLSDMLKLMRTRIISAGIATQAEIDSLMVQLENESQDRTSIYASSMSFCAWARKP